ncbi:MAG: hypothetical protein PHI27_06595 [Eubacteriales bacterium]|nr:hypothetical protein [Eubacteriales bacterium]MDD4513742.1 hypothetical protein [Eubacteriales bacterium]
MAGTPRSSVYIYIDTSDVDRVTQKLRMVMTQHQFELLMYRVFKRTGEHVKTIIKREVPKEYEAKPSWIASNIGKPKMSFGGIGGASVGCTIPIDGTRGVLGSRFSASGPRGRRRKSGKYSIHAKIVKGQSSTLPAVMSHQGGQPPFFNGKIVMTRKGKERLPIVRVAGLGVPQMPMNRSRDSVQTDILNTISARIEHEYARLVGGS